MNTWAVLFFYTSPSAIINQAFRANTSWDTFSLELWETRIIPTWLFNRILNMIQPITIHMPYFCSYSFWKTNHTQMHYLKCTANIESVWAKVRYGVMSQNLSNIWNMIRKKLLSRFYMGIFIPSPQNWRILYMFDRALAFKYEMASDFTSCIKCYFKQKLGSSQYSFSGVH